LLRLFVGKVGLFPVGSLVRLESGELALVVDPPASELEAAFPRVRLLEGGPGSWTTGEERRLGPETTGAVERRIAGGCHPQDAGVHVDRLLAERYLEGAGPDAVAVSPS
jgi:hypothetical protein